MKRARMMQMTLILGTLAGLVLAAKAAGGTNEKLSGTYSEFSGTVGDRDMPKKNDMKVAFHITGKLAADLYRHLGHSAKVESCDTDIMVESRGRGGLDCVLYKKTGVECWFGLDSKSGRSTGGIVC